MYARPIKVQTKVHFKMLQFLVVTYDMGFLRRVIDVDSSLFLFCLRYL